MTRWWVAGHRLTRCRFRSRVDDFERPRTRHPHHPPFNYMHQVRWGFCGPILEEWEVPRGRPLPARPREATGISLVGRPIRRPARSDPDRPQVSHNLQQEQDGYMSMSLGMMPGRDGLDLSARAGIRTEDSFKVFGPRSAAPIYITPNYWTNDPYHESQIASDAAFAANLQGSDLNAQKAFYRSTSARASSGEQQPKAQYQGKGKGRAAGNSRTGSGQTHITPRMQRGPPTAGQSKASSSSTAKPTLRRGRGGGGGARA